MDDKNKYNNALEKLQEALAPKDGCEISGLTRACIEEIFPELKESEDEKIRKSIIENLKGNMYRADGDYDLLNKQIAWLEKQGNKPQGKTALEAVEEEKVDNQNCVKSDDKVEVEHLIPTKGIYYTCIKDYYSSDNTHLCVKGNVYKSSFNGYIDDESHFGLSWTNSCAEKYFEPTKDEAWIVCEHDNVIGKPMQYKEFKKKVNQKFIENLKAEGITPKLRLWNIHDAKDGDILVASDESIFIYAGSTDRHAKFYAALTKNGRINVEGGIWEDKNSVHPAIKEQRDTLLKAMADAGYEWDAEKKELKKSEPKFKVGDLVVISTTKGDRVVQIASVEYFTKDGHPSYITTEGIWFGNGTEARLLTDKDVEIATIPESKAIVNKIESWSEEDEKNLTRAIWYVENPALNVVKDTMLSEWLKSIKGRIQPQPKQEWSEEDEKIALSIEQVMNCASLLNIVPQKIDKVRTWLKSLKDRYTWKPSNIQMECLYDAVNHYHTNGYPASNLTELYEQMSKIYKL